MNEFCYTIISLLYLFKFSSQLTKKKCKHDSTCYMIRSRINTIKILLFEYILKLSLVLDFNKIVQFLNWNKSQQNIDCP